MGYELFKKSVVRPLTQQAELCRVVNAQARLDSKNRMFKLGLNLIRAYK